jgi:hypothetical protein
MHYKGTNGCLPRGSGVTWEGRAGYLSGEFRGALVQRGVLDDAVLQLRLGAVRPRRLHRQKSTTGQ